MAVNEHSTQLVFSACVKICFHCAATDAAVVTFNAMLETTQH